MPLLPSTGQFWNIPVSVTPYTGLLRDGSQAQGLFTARITTSGATEPRIFSGWLYRLTWEFEEGPCLYVGNKQSGPIYEVTPNDGVIAETYKDYQVDSAFSEENYNFGLFSEERCGTASPTTEAPASTTMDAPVIIPR